MAGVAGDGEAISAGAGPGGGGAASSFDGECGGSLFADGEVAEESGGVSGGVWGDSFGDAIDGPGGVARSHGQRKECAGTAGDFRGGVDSSSPVELRSTDSRGRLSPHIRHPMAFLAWLTAHVSRGGSTVLHFSLLFIFFFSFFL